ncbi:MAG: hypothetical protein WDN03_10445 [Rhizomicrobium sp.]
MHSDRPDDAAALAQISDMAGRKVWKTPTVVVSHIRGAKHGVDTNGVESSSPPQIPS